MLYITFIVFKFRKNIPEKFMLNIRRFKALLWKLDIEDGFCYLSKRQKLFS